MDITGNAFVTGGASGIGKATCIALAKEGAQGILVTDINLKSAQQTVVEATAVASNPNFRAEAVHLDVTLEESVKNAVAYMVKSFGRIDYCVHSAGIPVRSNYSISEAIAAEMKTQLEINVMGTFLVLSQISAVMKLQDLKPLDANYPYIGGTRGSIVSLGSAASLTTAPGIVQYTTAKHAVVGTIKTAALDNAAFSIRVNCICPSWVNTPMLDEVKDAVPWLDDKTVLTGIPMNRVATAKEVADVALFLCSPRSSFVTGVALPVDGGMTISYQ